MKLNKSLWWGSLPWEPDGGAVVNYYLLKELNRLEPNHEFHGIPKQPSFVVPNSLPFMKWKLVDYYEGGVFNNKHLFQEIPNYMVDNDIPLLSTFHIPPEFLGISTLLHNIGKKMIVHQTIHWATDEIFKIDLNDIDGWIAPTKWGEEQLKNVGKLQQNKVTYIPHSVDMTNFYPHETQIRKALNLKDDQKIILVVGRCSLAKGFHQIIPIMRPIINDYNAMFIIKGGVYDRIEKSQEIGFIIKRLEKSIPSNIIWIPDWNAPEKMAELMASCDILLQPSGHEGFDVPLVEAMATKKAIAVTNIPNHYEIMGRKNRYCGIFMEPTVPAETVNDGKQVIKVPSSDVIEGTLRFMLENPDECKAYGENGYIRVQKNYDLKMIGKRWIDYMDGIVYG